jgi:ribonuclease VapC
MFVDASAMLAILLDEPEGVAFAKALDSSGAAHPFTSTLAVWETAVGLYRRKAIPIAEAEARVDEFLALARIEVVGIATSDLSAALQAFDRYGRHRYPETQRNRALNLADCFHYAVAKSRRAPILHKDDGMSATDVASVR